MHGVLGGKIEFHFRVWTRIRIRVTNEAPVQVLGNPEWAILFGFMVLLLIGGHVFIEMIIIPQHIGVKCNFKSQDPDMLTNWFMMI